MAEGKMRTPPVSPSANWTAPSCTPMTGAIEVGTRLPAWMERARPGWGVKQGHVIVGDHARLANDIARAKQAVDRMGRRHDSTVLVDDSHMRRVRAFVERRHTGRPGLGAGWVDQRTAVLGIGLGNQLLDGHVQECWDRPVEASRSAKAIFMASAIRWIVSGAP